MRSERTHTEAQELLVADVMTRSFVTCEPQDTLGEVAEKLAANDVGSALVVDFGRLIGILTSRDVVRALAVRAHPSDARAREWMSGPPVTATPETATDEAARMMLEGGFHHLPVVENERPVGMVGLRAVVGAIGTLGPGW